MLKKDEQYKYAVSAVFRGSRVHLSMLSDRFRVHGYGYQESFRKVKDERYRLKLWFFNTEDFRKFEHFLKLINMGKVNNPAVDMVSKVRVNYHTKKVINKDFANKDKALA